MRWDAGRIAEVRFVPCCFAPRLPFFRALSDQLTRGHYVELLFIDHDLERSFYEKQAILERWTVRELKHQKNLAINPYFF
ncbi:MAG: hypothetical protein HUU34_03145 [Saprospiraceae bacterium]|nr:hypothetical protein [Saprospiraceae bacterium]